MRKLNLDKNILKILYIDNEMTSYEVAFLLGCTTRSVFQYLKKYNLKIRNLSEAQKLAIKKGRTMNLPKNKKGNKASNWQGGFKKSGEYLYIYSQNHPNRTKAGYVSQHRLIIEKHLGRYLTKQEQIHHINENKKSIFM